jgi:NADPH2:quinone reductase
MSEMRAALCRSYGPPDVVVVTDVATPALGQGQVRVKIEVGSVNFPDVLLIANSYQISVPTPFIPGSEFAGLVSEVGDGVDQIAVGARVFGSTLVGAFAEEVVVPVTSITSVPPGIDSKVAAGFGVTYRTAYHVLRSVAELQPGEELVVLGAGGGVGSAAVQLGAAMGASVTAVASSPEKLEAARASGAQRFINHGSGNLRQELRDALPDGSHVVFDPVGGDLAEPALRSLRWGGRFVTVGYASGSIPRIPLNLVLLKGVHIHGFQFRDFALHAPEDLARNDLELLDLLRQGRARPLIGATFDLSDTVLALRHVAEGLAVGKTLIRVGRHWDRA